MDISNTDRTVNLDKEIKQSTHTLKNESVEALTFLKEYRSRNKDKVIIANININSIRNKISSLKEIISKNVDILVIEETKIDDTFPENYFVIPGYKKPYRKDRNANGGGILVYVREDIPSKEVISTALDPNIEGLFIEINLKKSKWILFATYKPPSLMQKTYLKLMK